MSSTAEWAPIPAARYDDFLRRFPAYRDTTAVDELRATDYARLDRLGHVYLDYTGGSLYAESQLRRHHDLLSTCVLGNPHSSNPTSLESSRHVEEARAAVRRFFNVQDDEYEVVFIANASGALKLVGESYPFRSGGTYLLSYDNHNSVNGIREFAARKGAAVVYVPVRDPELRLDEDLLRGALAARPTTTGAEPGTAAGSSPAAGSTGGSSDGPGADRLFAYPAQSNFSGVQHPLEWIAEAQSQGWDVLLDCAAFAPTNRLDLSVVKPDFVPVSFYKLFGYPTGVGCLLARRDKLGKLRRPWFAGGTITVASVQEERWYRLAPGAAGFEDGTLDYLALPAVVIGLEHVSAIGIETIHARVGALAGWLLEELAALRHGNGAPMVHVFGPQGMEGRGATIAFDVLDPDGRPFDTVDVEEAAGERLISLRDGCFCNPGDGEVAHHVLHDEMEVVFPDGGGTVASEAGCPLRAGSLLHRLRNTLRLSLGIVSDFGDVYRFVDFVQSYRDRPLSF
jgi:selenocysteine lyase/cysteine desulfurase